MENDAGVTTPGGRCLTSEDKKKVGAFLNPVRKDVRKFALSIVRENSEKL